MMALLKKDFRNTLASLGPALLLGIPLLLVMEFTKDASTPLSWKTAFWIAYFLGSTSLFYRSFSIEHASKTFGIYTAFRVNRLKLWLSQSLLHFAGATLMGIIYSLVAFIFWSPSWAELKEVLIWIPAASLVLSPLGASLGLMLQIEREFMFSVFYLPLATPVVLASHELSSHGYSMWALVLVVFGLMGGFISALIFEFFFDELTPS